LQNKVISYKRLGKTKVLVHYVNKLDPAIIKSHHLDIVKLASKKKKDNELLNLDFSSIPISAAVTAYGRIHISKVKLDIINRGGKIYYSDTDSIVTNLKLPQELISPTEIGKLKVEANIKEGIFISGKTYAFITDGNKFVNKAKGVKSSSLSYIDYIKLLNNQSVNTAVKSYTKKV